MKKYFSILTAVLLACLATMSLTACGSDDDNNDTPDIPAPSGVTPVSAELTTYAWFSQDMVDLLNIDVTYRDADGVTQKAEVGKTPETVSFLGKSYNVYPVKAKISTTRFPAELDMEIHYTKKAGVAVQPDQIFSFTFISQNEAYVTYSNGQTLGMKNPILDGSTRSFKGDKLDDVIRRFNDSHDDVEVEVKKNGTIDF